MLVTAPSPFERWSAEAAVPLGIRCARCRRPVERITSQVCGFERAVRVTVECHGATETVALAFDLLTAPHGGHVVVEAGVAFAADALPGPVAPLGLGD